MIDFDSSDIWAPRLSQVLSGCLREATSSEVKSANPEDPHRALNILLSLNDRDEIIDRTLEWLRSVAVAGYHGTRLTDDEVASVQATGLLTLAAEARRDRLIRALSRHKRWTDVAGNLDATIEAYGAGARAGCREGQAHLTLSRSGLTNGFNHYITHGAEFDQHVAHALLGSEGKELLQLDGKARVIRFAVPGSIALDAAHPYFSVADLRANGDVPNIVDEFLKAWSYRVAHPGFQTRTLQVDCGLVFRSTVSGSWIREIETLPC